MRTLHWHFTALLGLSVTITIGCAGAPEPRAITSPQGFQRPGWQRTLVHPEISAFRAEEFAIDAGNREEFDNLVRVIAGAFEPLPEFDRRGPTFQETLREVAWRMQQRDRPARAILVHHVRRVPGGRLEAEGMVLSLATLLERDGPSEYYETLTLRLEDRIVEGAVDGELDFVQLLIDTNTTALGAMEVLLDREEGSRSPGWRARVSRVYDSGSLMREGTGTHQATDLGRIADHLEEMIWRPFAVPLTSESAIVPEGVSLVPRLPREIPRGTNFPPGD